MRPWLQKCAPTALCVLAPFLGASSALAEGGGRVPGGATASVARIDFQVRVPHFLDVRVAASGGPAEEPASSLLAKVRDGARQPLGGLGAETAALRADNVRVASNRGQVMLAMSSDSRAAGAARMNDRSFPELRSGPQYFLRAVAFAVEGRPGIREVGGAMPVPDRAGVTQLKTAWLRAYSHAANFVRPVARSEFPGDSAPIATYIAAVP